MTPIFENFSARKAAELAGFKTIAMLDYLQRSGVFFPRGTRGRRGRGQGRKYDFRDILVLKAIKRLLDSGASVAHLRKALEAFQKIAWIADPVTMEDSQGVIRYLIASVDGIHLVRDADVLVNLSRSGQLAFSFIIDLERLRDELRHSLGMPQLQHELSFPT